MRKFQRIPASLALLLFRSQSGEVAPRDATLYLVYMCIYIYIYVCVYIIIYVYIIMYIYHSLYGTYIQGFMRKEGQ